MYSDHDKIHVDPTKSALAVLGGNAKQTDESNQRYLKRQLTVYLEALLLVQQFNELETTRFELAQSDQIARILERVMIN
ncbi:hypothetical protein [Furfurilactobacillus curtus]|uniref:Uncharacterized protein n=1 Tax=Furfurilactobacillus curtus TaxID=1746200 RepID=A0ABQ5JQ00_9LACO